MDYCNSNYIANIMEAQIDYSQINVGDVFILDGSEIVITNKHIPMRGDDQDEYRIVYYFVVNPTINISKCLSNFRSTDNGWVTEKVVEHSSDKLSANKPDELDS